MAIDGKSIRGAAAGGGTRPHLLSAVTHDDSIVLAGRQIPDKGSEISELAPLVAGLDLTGKVVTVDALCRYRHKASYADLRIMPMSGPKALVVAVSVVVRSA